MKNVEKTAENLGLTLTRPHITKKQCHHSNVSSNDSWTCDNESAES